MSRWLTARAALDRLIAAVALVLSSPLLAAAVVLVRLTSAGPAVIKLRRVGQHGEVFWMWKVRSMRSAGRGGLAAGSALTSVGDDRITPVGRWLRRARVDELPQLLNVMAGQMALIGPRPEDPAHVDRGDERWRRVLQARPGIAGPTQVLVHDLESTMVTEAADRYVRDLLPVKLAIDEWYVIHASPSADALVLVSLAERFLLGRRTTTIHQRVLREVEPARALAAMAADGTPVAVCAPRSSAPPEGDGPQGLKA